MTHTANAKNIPIQVCTILFLRNVPLSAFSRHISLHHISQAPQAIKLHRANSQTHKHVRNPAHNETREQGERAPFPRNSRKTDGIIQVNNASYVSLPESFAPPSNAHLLNPSLPSLYTRPPHTSSTPKCDEVKVPSEINYILSRAKGAIKSTYPLAYAEWPFAVPYPRNPGPWRQAPYAPHFRPLHTRARGGPLNSGLLFACARGEIVQKKIGGPRLRSTRGKSRKMDGTRSVGVDTPWKTASCVICN